MSRGPSKLSWVRWQLLPWVCQQICSSSLLDERSRLDASRWKSANLEAAAIVRLPRECLIVWLGENRRDLCKSTPWQVVLTDNFSEYSPESDQMREVLWASVVGGVQLVGHLTGLRKEETSWTSQSQWKVERQLTPGSAKEPFFLPAGELLVTTGIVCPCLHGWYTLRKVLFDEENGWEQRIRDVSLFHLVTWVHFCLVGVVALVGFVAVPFCSIYFVLFVVLMTFLWRFASF